MAIDRRRQPQMRITGDPLSTEPEDVALARAIRAVWSASGRDLWRDMTPDERAAWAQEAAKIRRRLLEFGYRIVEW